GPGTVNVTVCPLKMRCSGSANSISTLCWPGGSPTTTIVLSCFDGVSDKSSLSSGAGTLHCKNVTADHFQAASQRTRAALSSRFLIQFLTMWAAASETGILRRPRGPRGRCGQPLRGPFHANADFAASFTGSFGFVSIRFLKNDQHQIEPQLSIGGDLPHF